MDLLELAKHHFGIEAFRGDQENIIKASLNQQDILVVQGTGFGKSLCFQLPAIVGSGITLVVSPLVALMDDQVSHLVEQNIWATALHHNLDRDEIQHRLDLLHLHQYQLVYLSPEKLASEKFLKDLALLPISHLVVDEAHCISEWGHQFRPAYRNISALRKVLRHYVAISAFTATAPLWVRNDIITSLEMKETAVFGGSILRENIRLSARYCELEMDKWQALIDYLAMIRCQKSPVDDSIIIYVITRVEAEQLAEIINHLVETTPDNPFAAAYHAGMDAADRQALQLAFQHGKIPCMVATNAFGMGVDKSNVRLVVLYGAPASPESLLQQIGRAGRDGNPATSVILFSKRDATVHQQLHSPYTGKIRHLLHHRLTEVANLLNTNKCRWRELAQYYDESIDTCNNCDNCSQKTDTILYRSKRRELSIGGQLTNRQDHIARSLQGAFPQASVRCIPGLGRGMYQHE